MESWIGPTVWVSGLGPNSGFDFTRFFFKPMQNLSWSSCKLPCGRFRFCIRVERL